MLLKNFFNSSKPTYFLQELEPEPVKKIPGTGAGQKRTGSVIKQNVRSSFADPNTLNLDPDTKFLVPVHFGPGSMDIGYVFNFERKC